VQIADSWGLQIFDYYYHGGQIADFSRVLEKPGAPGAF
jgi:hypothetical protein